MTTAIAWLPVSSGGWTTVIGRDRWTIRGPLRGPGGGRLYWVYRNGSRVNTNGSYETSVSFATAAKAKAFVAQLVA